MGEVFSGVDEHTNEEVAVKLLHRGLVRDDQQRERFEREAKALARLRHPSIVRVIDAGIHDDGRPYLVQEFLRGTLLLDIMRDGPFRLSEYFPVLEQIAAAMSYCHAQGIIHRDLKPDNVFVSDFMQPSPRVWVADFGVAKVFGEPSITMDGMVYGTPGYMAPEYLVGSPPGPQSDLYSLGVILYEFAVGRVPFTHRAPTQLMRAHVVDPPPSPRETYPDFDSRLEGVIMAVLAKNPAQRPVGVQGLIDALRPLLD